jgi:hypothetical protein
VLSLLAPAKLQPEFNLVSCNLDWIYPAMLTLVHQKNPEFILPVAVFEIRFHKYLKRRNYE